MMKNKNTLMNRSRAAVLGTLALLSAQSLWAAGWATYAVDDSMSQVQAPSAPLRWRNLLPSRDASNLMDARMDVRIVLNVAPWVGKPSRIYMVLPTLPQSHVEVQWTTSGVLSPGRLSGGQRYLVFQGVVPGPRIDDTMQVAVIADARDPVTPQRLNFTFEIEVPNP
jgi:hypothetical protein